MTRETAEALGWRFSDATELPRKAILPAEVRVTKFGRHEEELLQEIELWEAHQASRKPEARHPFVQRRET